MKNGNPRRFRRKARIAVVGNRGLAHTVTTTGANEANVGRVADLFNRAEE